MKESAKQLALNAMFLSHTGQPIRELRNGMDDLRECLSHAFDDEAYICFEGTRRKAAAAWLVLTDLRNWVWPQEAEDAEELAFEIVKRRLRATVRGDQCSKDDRP